MMRSLSSGPNSSLVKIGPVISDSEFCSEMSALRGERNMLVLYVGAYALGCTPRSRWQNSPNCRISSVIGSPPNLQPWAATAGRLGAGYGTTAQACPHSGPCATLAEVP